MWLGSSHSPTANQPSFRIPRRRQVRRCTTATSKPHPCAACSVHVVQLIVCHEHNGEGWVSLILLALESSADL